MSEGNVDPLSSALMKAVAVVVVVRRGVVWRDKHFSNRLVAVYSFLLVTNAASVWHGRRAFGSAGKAFCRPEIMTELVV